MDKCLFISRSALEYNVDFYIKETKKDFIAVIKNNAYGHGYKEVISILENKDIKMYAVSNYSEAKIVSEYTSKDILILDRLDDYLHIKDNMVVTIISKKHLRELIKLDIKLRVHLKINIGMKRKGIEKEELEECLELIESSKLVLEGVYTHYSSHKLKIVKKEFKKFKEVIDKVKDMDILIHASSSISSLVLKENDTNAIRIGVGMYGMKKLDKRMDKLKIVSELKCEVKNSYPIKRGDYLGYHSLYLGKKGYVNVVNLGYGDGLFYKEKIRGYINGIYIEEIGVRNMDNMYFYSSDYIMDNSIIEIYGKNNKIDDFSNKTKYAVCRILALLNENIVKKIID